MVKDPRTSSQSPDVPHSIALARRAGFERLNVDLIYAIPARTSRHGLHRLNHAIRPGQPIISPATACLRANTPRMAVKKRWARFARVGMRLSLEMLQSHPPVRLAKRASEPYEISNYAGPTRMRTLCLLNGGNYLGLALPPARISPAIAGKTAPTWANGKKPSPPTSFRHGVEHLTSSQRASELIMLQLRLSRAFDS